MNGRELYEAAIRWIAVNDNAGDDDSPEELGGYISVALVADLFGTASEEVAQAVYEERHAACEHCGRPAARRIPMELDASTGVYHGPGEVAQDKSQGVFMIGSGCARKLARR